MTVLRRDDVRGFESKRIGKVVAGLAIVAIGVAAAFGVSQLIDDTGAVEVPAVLAERGAAMQDNVETLTRNGQAQSAAQAAAAGQAATAGTLTLDQELAAIRARTGVEPAAQTGASESLQRVGSWAIPTTEAQAPGAMESLQRVGSWATTESVGGLVPGLASDVERAMIYGRTGVTSEAQGPAVTYTWTLEDELNAIRGRRGFEQAKPAPEPTSGPR